MTKQEILKRLTDEIAKFCGDRSIPDPDMLWILDELSGEIEARANCIRADLGLPEQ
jgi:hypothetical protein